MAYKYLELWFNGKHPSDYVGTDFTQYYCFLGRSRDSGLVEESNYRVGLARLRALPAMEDKQGDDTIQEEHASHWAVGWVESILIHPSNVAACEAADAMLEKLAESYPLLDEVDHSRREWEQASRYWYDLGENERKRYCREAGIAVRYARTKSLGTVLQHDNSGRLYEALIR